MKDCSRDKKDNANGVVSAGWLDSLFSTNIGNKNLNSLNDWRWVSIQNTPFRISLKAIVLSFMICNYSSVEARPLPPVQIPAKHGEIVSARSSIRGGTAALMLKRREQFLGSLIKLSPSVSAQRQPMTDQQAKKESNKRPADTHEILFLSLVTFLVGVILGGGFIYPERRRSSSNSVIRPYSKALVEWAT